MSDPLRATRFAICLALLMAISVAAGDAHHGDLVAPPNTAKARDSIERSEKAVRLREGSKLVDQVGEFQKSGDQISFFAKDTFGSLHVLENLALERIARVLDDNPTMRLWSVTGVVTEYRNENYLLITRAVLKAQTKKTAPAESPKSESVNKDGKNTSL